MAGDSMETCRKLRQGNRSGHVLAPPDNRPKRAEACHQDNMGTSRFLHTSVVMMFNRSQAMGFNPRILIFYGAKPRKISKFGSFPILAE
jgi:hypothetical protein